MSTNNKTGNDDNNSQASKGLEESIAPIIEITQSQDCRSDDRATRESPENLAQDLSLLKPRPIYSPRAMCATNYSPDQDSSSTPSVQGPSRVKSQPCVIEMVPLETFGESSTSCQQSTVSHAGTTEEERTCRVCFDPAKMLSRSRKLISPCLCKGTSKYIHIGCLQKWRQTAGKQSSAFACDTCLYHYSFRRPWIAEVLQASFMAHIISTLVFVALTYFAGWCCRRMNTSRFVWYIFKKLNPNPPVILGITYVDYMAGLIIIGAIGLIILIIRCCCSMTDPEERNRNRSSNGPNSSGSCIYIGDCGGGGSGDGDGEICAVILVFFWLIGFIYSFVCIYKAIKWVIKRILDSLGEIILEVK